MANPYRRLFSPNGIVPVRLARTAADAADWSPDNIDSGEVREEVLLDAREWDELLIVADFVGTVGGGTSLTIEPILEIAEAAGRRYLPLAPFTLTKQLESPATLIRVDGHFIAFRLTAYTLGTTTSVSIKATGGQKRRNLGGG